MKTVHSETTYSQQFGFFSKPRHKLLIGKEEPKQHTMGVLNKVSM